MFRGNLYGIKESSLIELCENASNLINAFEAKYRDICRENPPAIGKVKIKTWKSNINFFGEKGVE